MDLNDLIKKINEKYEKENIEDIVNNNILTKPEHDNFWIMAILLILLLDFPKKEEKQPVISIYVSGGDE